VPIYFLMRIASIVFVTMVATHTRHITWFAVVYSYALSHYLLGFVYSRRQFTAIASHHSSAIGFLSLVAFGAGLYWFHFPLALYFAAHHAFNEAYVVGKTIPTNSPTVRALRGSAVLLHLFIYVFLLRCSLNADFGDAMGYYFLLHTGPCESFANVNLLLAGLAVAYALFFYRLHQVRSFLDRRTLIENCGFELLGLGAIAWSFYVNIDFLDIVLYHVVFWSLFPLATMRARSSLASATYLALTAASIGVFFFASPAGPAQFRVPPAIFQNQFLFWSYMHITAAFALSNAHPSWIVGLFRPSPTPQASSPVLA
jgi:hypothetical protein